MARTAHEMISDILKREALKEVKNMKLEYVAIDEPLKSNKRLVITRFNADGDIYYIAGKKKYSNDECERALSLNELLNSLLTELNGKSCNYEYQDKPDSIWVDGKCVDFNYAIEIAGDLGWSFDIVKSKKP